MHQGFFFRAETFSQLAETIDEIAGDSPDAYGGVSLRERSHGLSLMAVFENRFGSRGVYVMDEPEGALSPDRLLDFIAILRRWSSPGRRR